eukprot:snap_masked-scaffold_3-processed-gene-15.45-mRNA-1 protein AED:1.00 eAED:1.00 QI:0/-1/0/0/-1/1/1/0/543
MSVSQRHKWCSAVITNSTWDKETLRTMIEDDNLFTKCLKSQLTPFMAMAYLGMHDELLDLFTSYELDEALLVKLKQWLVAEDTSTASIWVYAIFSNSFKTLSVLYNFWNAHFSGNLPLVTNDKRFVTLLNCLCYTVEHNFFSSEYDALIQWILRAGGDINKLSGNGFSNLHLCVSFKNPKFLRSLLSIDNVDLEPTNQSGDTPLLSAVNKSRWFLENHVSRIECVQSLLDAGANVNALDPREWSPLMLALGNMSFGSSPSMMTPIVDILIKSGADIFYSNGQGFSVLELCVRSDAPKFLELILEENVQNQQYEIEKPFCIGKKYLIEVFLTNFFVNELAKGDYTTDCLEVLMKYETNINLLWLRKYFVEYEKRDGTFRKKLYAMLKYLLQNYFEIFVSDVKQRKRQNFMMFIVTSKFKAAWNMCYHYFQLNKEVSSLFESYMEIDLNPVRQGKLVHHEVEKDYRHLRRHVICNICSSKLVKGDKYFSLEETDLIICESCTYVDSTEKNSADNNTIRLTFIDLIKQKSFIPALQDMMEHELYLA